MFQNISSIESKEVITGFKGRFIHTQQFTMAFWEVEKGAVLPEHSHVHEQTTMVTEGTFEMVIDGQKQLCTPGLIASIPSNVVHSGVALTDCKITDVFCPVREDYKSVS